MPQPPKSAQPSPHNVDAHVPLGSPPSEISSNKTPGFSSTFPKRTKRNWTMLESFPNMGMANAFVKQQPFLLKRKYHNGNTCVYVCVEHVGCEYHIRYSPSQLDPLGKDTWIVHTSGVHSPDRAFSSVPDRGVHPRFIKEVDDLIAMNVKPVAIYHGLHHRYKGDVEALKMLPSKGAIAIRKRTLTMKANGRNRIESIADMKEWTEGHVLPNLRADALKVPRDEIVVLPGGIFHSDEAEGFCVSCPALLENVIRAREAWGPAIPLVCDGTYKLTYNGWVLLALGTTHHRYDKKNSVIAHQFRPISFMLAKTEAGPNVTLLLQSTAATIEVLHEVRMDCCHI